MRTLFILALGLCACGDSDEPSRWSIVREKMPAALLSVWGSSADDVWAVGSDAGSGPAVLHRENGEWKELSTGMRGDLWWVFGFANGPVYLGGSAGMILRYQNGMFTKMTTPGQAIVYGIWGSSPDDVWAVGANEGGANGGFAWRLSGDQWIDAPGFPKAEVEDAAIWKLYGRGPNDVWLIGTFGLTMHWNGTAFETVNANTGESLFTVQANAERFVAVGGFGTGVILENTGSGWMSTGPAGIPAIIGVCAAPDGGFFSVGMDGTVLIRGDNGWVAEDTTLAVYETYHSCWVDPSGGFWAAGGRVTSFPLVDGVLVHRAPGGTK